MGRGNGCHPHDGVHGGADVVTHVGKELALGLASLLSRPSGFLQFLHLRPV